MPSTDNNDQTSCARKGINEVIESFLGQHYTFRYNEIKEFAEYLKGDGWVQVGRYELNSMRRRLDREVGISTSPKNLQSIIESDFTQKVNPVVEYFTLLPGITGTRSIDALAATVDVVNSEHWTEYLKRWIVAMYANAISERECRNHSCLTLTGPQGTFKTTWLNHLCPKPLSDYLFTGKIDPNGKDIQMCIAECVLINIDDNLRTLNRRDADAVKQLITTSIIKVRRPYDTHVHEYRHLASFCASVNGSEFLSDPTGSRRFLVFEVRSIDIARALEINMDDVFAEAKRLYEDGYRYWFNDEENRELSEMNTMFDIQTQEYELLFECFEPVRGEDDEREGTTFTTTAILNHIQERHPNVKLNLKYMGQALRKAGFERCSMRIGGEPVYVWRARAVNR